MQIKIAVAKINRHGNGSSGDTVEVIERPYGGISVVLADGQIDHVNSKIASTMVSHRVIDHISEGVRDGAAIRATASSLFTEHQGKVQSNLNVISVDLQSNTIIVSRNSPVPVFLISDEEVDCLSSPTEPIGERIDITPSIVELEIVPGMAIVAVSDGVYHAGRQDQTNLDFCTTIGSIFDEHAPTAQEIANFLLNRAIRLDEDRPKDDMSIVVLLVSPESTDRIRRMTVSMSLDS